MVVPSQISPEDATSKLYHFVIVGGGTAGLTLAANLTEDPLVNVLVLEAGENRLDDSKIMIPAFMSQLYENPDYDWCFKTVPQNGLNDRVVAQPRGKVLGGTSAINFMMLSHASHADIDAWGALGNPEWNAKMLEPYYRKFETYNAPDESRVKDLGSNIIDVSLHGNSGPVQITSAHATGDLDHAWRPTLHTMGLAAEADPRKGDTLGGYSVLKFIDTDAKRSYAASAFFAPNSSRTNLVVLTSAHVNKVVLEKQGDALATATGVLFSVAGKEYFAATKGEVILCAGSYQSPQILELSGIGSKALLDELDIKTIIENPNVGENLQDHVMVPLEFEAVEGLPTAETIKQPGVLDWALSEWMAGRGGPLASGVSGTGFLTYSSILPEDSRSARLENITKEITRSIPSGPSGNQLEIQKNIFLDPKEADIQFNFAPTGFNPYSGEKLSGLFQHDDPGNYVGLVACLAHPYSRGSVHSSSSDSKTAPVIDPRYLSHPADTEMLLDSLLFIQSFMETQPIEKMIKDNEDGTGKKIQPNTKLASKLDKAKALIYLKDATISSWHPIGTCSMLPEADGGVVDTRLRVYGTNNLRVVDASIMPLHVRGNIASTVYAIAGLAADLIAEDFHN